ncbi:MAG TPA: hypothetical protein PKL14_09620 [Holophaga sp.]|nr:hypothetical protein [Holophaga sp.]
MFQKLRPILNLTVVVASLGYFVDMFDLLLFPVLRQSSLTALGVTGDAQVATGAYLLNMQMAGMLLGGIFWGVLGDKKGRLSTLFGSIACTRSPISPTLLCIRCPPTHSGALRPGWAWRVNWGPQ